MRTHITTKSTRIAAVAVFALLLATGAGARAATSAVTGGASGGAYLMADGNYGIGLGFGVRTGGETAPTNDAQVCATSGSMCIAP